MWQKKETENYVFHYHGGSVAERDLKSITEGQESCHKCICDVLNVKMDKKINYFLCNTREEVGELYGDNDPCSGFARMPNEIYAVYNEKIKCVGYHEDVHMISYNTMARPEPNFIREGLAMYFDRTWWGIPNEAWVQVFMNKGLYVSISSLMNKDGFFSYSDTLTYPIAGAFIGYLIEVFGMESFKGYYNKPSKDFGKDFYSSFNKSINDVEESFKRYIKNIGYDERILDIIEAYIKEKF